MRIALLVLSILIGPLAAQQRQTQMWGDLKLGMTAAEVRKALTYRINAPRKREQIPGRSVPGIMKLQVPRGLLGGLPVTAAIYFEEEGDSLSGVLLISDHESPNYCDLPGGLEKQAATLLWQTFLAELRKQNGEPSLSRTAEGENTTVSTMIAIWDGAPGSPDIILLMMGTCKRVDVTVAYAPSGYRKTIVPVDSPTTR